MNSGVLNEHQDMLRRGNHYRRGSFREDPELLNLRLWLPTRKVFKNTDAHDPLVAIPIYLGWGSAIVMLMCSGLRAIAVKGAVCLCVPHTVVCPGIFLDINDG